MLSHTLCVTNIHFRYLISQRWYHCSIQHKHITEEKESRVICLLWIKERGKDRIPQATLFFRSHSRVTQYHTLIFAIYQLTITMPSLIVPITNDIKIKNSCRQNVKHKTPPSSSTEAIEIEPKVKPNIYIFSISSCLYPCQSNTHVFFIRICLYILGRFYRSNWLIESQL